MLPNHSPEFGREPARAKIPGVALQNGSLQGDSGFEFRIASTRAERDQAFALTYECYRKKGLIQENAFRRRLTHYHLHPHTNVFVGIRGGAVVSTATLIGDSSNGLPCEDLYSADIHGFRTEGLNMAEVSCLASSIPSLSESHACFIGILRLLAQHAKTFGIDQLVAAVHPKHAQFYTRTMGFRYFGFETSYETVCYAPAIGCSMNFADVEQTRPPYYDILLGNPLPLPQLLPCPMSPRDSEHFSRMLPATYEAVPLGV